MRRRLLSIVVCIIAIMSLLSFTINAEEEPISISSELILSEGNCYLNESTQQPFSTEKITYDADTKTYTFTDFHLVSTADVALTCLDTEATFYFVGDNSITCESTNWGSSAVFLDGAVTISGDSNATLTVMATDDAADEVIGIQAYKLYINTITLNVEVSSSNDNSGAIAIDTSGSEDCIEIVSGNISLIANSDKALGINGTFIIRGGETSIESSYCAINVKPDAASAIEGGTVTLVGEYYASLNYDPYIKTIEEMDAFKITSSNNCDGSESFEFGNHPTQVKYTKYELWVDVLDNPEDAYWITLKNGKVYRNDFLNGTTELTGAELENTNIEVSYVSEDENKCEYILSGINIDTNAPVGLVVVGNYATLVLEEGTTNTITTGNLFPDKSEGLILSCNYPTITGSGELVINLSDHEEASGIFTLADYTYIEDASVIINGENISEDVTGIACRYLIIENANINIDLESGDNSCGIHCYGVLFDSSIATIRALSDDTSYAIRVLESGPRIVIWGGDVSLSADKLCWGFYNNLGTSLSPYTLNEVNVETVRVYASSDMNGTMSFESLLSSWIGDGTYGTSEYKYMRFVDISRPIPTATPTPIPTPTTSPTPIPTSTPTPTPVSENGVSGFVERLYTVALNRPSEQEGKTNWVNALTSRRENGASVARFFCLSQEMINRNLTNEQYVEMLYRVFFDRDPDPMGFENWLMKLNEGESRESIIDGFVNSIEWANVCVRFGIDSGGTALSNLTPSEDVISFVNRLYSTCLGRPSEPTGLEDWSWKIANRRNTASEVAYGFFFSSEFIGFELNDTEYLERLYQTFMDRGSDEGGRNYWLERMANGTSREEVFYGFSGSNEFRAICESYGISP